MSMHNHFTVMGREESVSNSGWLEDEDEESDDSPSHRRRRSSFGDAEEVLFQSQQQTISNGLHQRRAVHPPRTPQSQSSHAHNDNYETPTPKRKSNASLPSYYHATTTTSTMIKKSQWIRYALLVCFALYIGLLIQTSLWLVQSGSSDNSSNKSSSSSSFWKYEWTLSTTARAQQEGRRLDYPSTIATTKMTTLSAQEWSLAQEALQERTIEVARERNEARRRRTTLAGVSQDATTGIGWYQVQSLPSTSDPHRRLSATTKRLASTDQLCGAIARSAASGNATSFHYPSTTALDSEARVFITGILSSALGMNLAIRLHEECGVEHIGGVDSMFPNTVAHRLQWVDERLKLLVTKIPKFQKPLGLSYLGVIPQSKDDDSEQYLQDYFETFQPTHVVHLASVAQQYPQHDAMEHSPYAKATWFSRQSAWWGMEQVLAAMQSMASPPQFLYVGTSSSVSPFIRAQEDMERVLVQTYDHSNTLSVQLPQIYGEWDVPGSSVYQAMERVVNGAAHTSSTIEESTMFSLMHVDDAVDALIAALQYEPMEPTNIDISSRASSPGIAGKQLELFLESHAAIGRAAVQIDNAAPTLPTTRIHPALAGWKPKIHLSQGLIRTLAWHLHRQHPYGNKDQSLETVDQFLVRHGQEPCAADDWMCHKSLTASFPCMSECNTRQECLPSIFDETQALAKTVTEGCQIVLYTQALGYNVKDLPLQSEYMDDANLDDDTKLICNYAFVPRDSSLVKSVTSKVPNEQLFKFGVDVKGNTNKANLQEMKLEGLNGRLLYRGWILLWVNDATTLLSPTDQSLLKVSPSKLFHSDVERAIFMEENFSVSPNLEDVSFLVDQLERRALPKRTFKKDVKVETSFGNEVVKRQKFRLPPEPPRRAVILFAPLRLPNDPHDESIQRIRRGDKKLKVRDAVKFMRHEWELEGTRESESERRQREFYERISSYVNRNDKRSPNEPWYRYSMRHWVRTRWVVHDMDLEEARLLRCDWYQEHLLWGSELDQLAFAHVMAVREVKRRMAHDEPDDHVKTFIEEHPHLKDLTDSYEWHAMETDMNLLYREPIQWNSLLPDHVTVEVEEEPASADVDPDQPIPLYVRIISERVMAASRKIWAKDQKKKRKETQNKKH